MCVRVECKKVKVRYPFRNFIKEFGFNFKSREEGGMLTYFYGFFGHLFQTEIKIDFKTN